MRTYSGAIAFYYAKMTASHLKKRKKSIKLYYHSVELDPTLLSSYLEIAKEYAILDEPMKALKELDSGSKKVVAIPGYNSRNILSNDYPLKCFVPQYQARLCYLIVSGNLRYIIIIRRRRIII